jgi:hypothetical protein
MRVRACGKSPAHRLAAGCSSQRDAHFATTWLCVSFSMSLRPDEPRNSRSVEGVFATTGSEDYGVTAQPSRIRCQRPVAPLTSACC